MYNIESNYEITNWYKPYLIPQVSAIYPLDENLPNFKFILVNQDIPYYYDAHGNNLWGDNFTSNLSKSRRFILHTSPLSSDIYPFSLYFVDPMTMIKTLLIEDSDYTIDNDDNRVINISGSFTKDGLFFASYIPVEYKLTCEQFSALYNDLIISRVSPPIFKEHIIRIRHAINDIYLVIKTFADAHNTNTNMPPLVWTGGYDNISKSTDYTILSTFSKFSIEIINELINNLYIIINSEDGYITQIGEVAVFPIISLINKTYEASSTIEQICQLINEVEDFIIDNNLVV